MRSQGSALQTRLSFTHHSKPHRILSCLGPKTPIFSLLGISNPEKGLIKGTRTGLGPKKAQVSPKYPQTFIAYLDSTPTHQMRLINSRNQLQGMEAELILILGGSRVFYNFRIFEILVIKKCGLPRFIKIAVFCGSIILIELEIQEPSRKSYRTLKPQTLQEEI